MVDLQRDLRNLTYLNHVSSDPVCCHPAHRMFLGSSINTRCTISMQAADFALELYLHAIVLSGFSRGAQLGVFNFNRTLARLPRNCACFTRLNQLCCRLSPVCLSCTMHIFQQRKHRRHTISMQALGLKMIQTNSQGAISEGFRYQNLQ